MPMAMRRGSPLRMMSAENVRHGAGREGMPAEAGFIARRRIFMIIEPQALVRHGLALTLSSLYDGAQTLQAASAMEATELLASAAAAPDIILMDADGMVGDRMIIVADFLAELPDVPVIIMAGSYQPAEARTFLAAGAVACLLKTDPSAVLADAVGLALAREGYVQLPYQLVAQPQFAPVPDGGLDHSAVARLTNRQRDIFRLLLSGCSNKEIARQLGVLEGTVKVHVRAMMQKLGARNRTQIAILAARTGVGAD